MIFLIQLLICCSNNNIFGVEAGPFFGGGSLYPSNNLDRTCLQQLGPSLQLKEITMSCNYIDNLVLCTGLGLHLPLLNQAVPLQ